MTLGEAFTIRLKELLKQHNLTLHKFLTTNCIARSTIVNIMKGNTRCPTLAVVYQVADGFNMSVIEFLDCPEFKRDDLEYNWFYNKKHRGRRNPVSKEDFVFLT